MINLHKDIAASLRCPGCQGALENGGATLRCLQTSCGATYPIIDGVPVLIYEARSLVSVDDIVALARTQRDPAPSLMKKLGKRLLPTLSRNLKADENYRHFAELLTDSGKTRARILNLGGGEVGVGLTNLLDSPNLEFVKSDVVPGDGVEIVCDAQDIPFADGTFDGVIIQGVLEFLPEVEHCMSHIHRVLRPGGLVYAETPFMQQVAGQYDLRRYTLLGHRRLFKDFDEILSGPVGGPGMALAWSYKHFLLSFVSSRRMRRALTVFAHLTAFWLKYLDRFLIDKPGTVDAAAGFSFLGKKSDRGISDREIVRAYGGRVAGLW